jgi:hypothetical protein
VLFSDATQNPQHCENFAQIALRLVKPPRL